MNVLYKNRIRYLLFWGLLMALRPAMQAQSAKFRVLATTSFLADMAQNVAGDYAEVESLMPIGGDPHIYDPVPGDAQKVVDADLIFRNGLHLEGWLDEMLENSGTEAPIVTVTDGVPAIGSQDYVDAYDPHAWMDIRLGLIYIENMKKSLVNMLPGDADSIEANYQRYRAELIELDEFIEAEIARIPPERRVLITSHDAFQYYGRRYGLELASVMGTSTEAEVQVADLLYLKEVIRTKGVSAIYVESTLNPKLIEQVASDEKVIIGGKLFADSLGDKESGADTYLKMLRQNTILIVKGLSVAIGQGIDEKSNAYIFVILACFAIAFVGVQYRLRSKSIVGLSWKDYQLEIKGLSVSYDRKTALSNVYLDVEPGYVTGLIGGNGSGKSTMFKAILGLLEPDAGSIRINGQKIEDIRKYVSYIPQKEEIDWDFPATVLDVALLGRYPHLGVFERLDSADKQKALSALRMLGVEQFKDKQIGELSGGQQQRVFIARALCQEAEIYLLDEPFVGVDITSEAKIMEIMKELAAEGKLVVIIHHDLAKVKDYFDRLIMINQHVVAAGETETIFTDENIKKTYGGRLTILQKTESYV